MNFLTRWWNRRKLKVELPKPERKCDFCGEKADWWCVTHKEFACTEHLVRPFHGIDCELMSWATYLDAVTGKVR